MTGDRFASILDDVLPEMKGKVYGSKGFFVVQVAIPLHFTKAVMQVLARNDVDVSVKNKWPPNSSDLNPIEHLWAILKERVGERNPVSREELMMVASEEWARIPQETIQNCIAALPARLATVRISKGGYTGK